MSTANVLKILEQADSVDHAEGLIAYRRYRDVCAGLAEYYGYPLEATVAAFAALSPNNDYKGNLRSTATVLRGHSRGLPPEECTVSTYGHCRDRAYAYLSGANFLATVKGKKIRSFYQNILDPEDAYPVTIDGHAVNIYRGARVSLKTVAALRFNYEEIAHAYREVAFKACLLPNQVQAITWFTWKRVNSILYGGRQYELYRDVSGDFWRTAYNPEEIKPFA